MYLNAEPTAATVARIFISITGYAEPGWIWNANAVSRSTSETNPRDIAAEMAHAKAGAARDRMK